MVRLRRLLKRKIILFQNGKRSSHYKQAVLLKPYYQHTALIAKHNHVKQTSVQLKGRRSALAHARLAMRHLHVAMTIVSFCLNQGQTLQRTIASDRSLLQTVPTIPFYNNEHFFILLLTSGDHAFQPDDVRMVKLPHDGGLRQEVAPLLVRVARLQALDGNVDLPLSLDTQSSAAHLPELSW